MSSSVHHRYHFTLRYFILFIIVVTGFFAFVRTVGRPDAQLQIGSVLAIAYLFWGLMHHHYERDLHWKIVVEYLALTFFGLGLFWMLLKLL